MSENGRTKDELISEGEPIMGIPIWIRLVIGTLTTIVLITSVVLICLYATEPTKYASPKDLQLSNLLIFGLTVLFILLVPWERLGIRIRKIGSVEFDRIISGQAREHIEEFSELRARIEELEGKIRSLDEVASITESFMSQELRPLLMQFLNAYQPNAYSPLRINKWGARQTGFEKLANFSQGDIRKVLQDMVAEGKVATRVSRLGNTLYKVVD